VRRGRYRISPFPSASSLRALNNGDAGSCWNSIGTSNEKLQAMNTLVSNGNHSAAHYLASHLKRLGGGNLEDALIALGQFSEMDMAGFLELTRAHVLTSRESSDALTMLPFHDRRTEDPTCCDGEETRGGHSYFSEVSGKIQNGRPFRNRPVRDGDKAVQ